MTKLDDLLTRQAEMQVEFKKIEREIIQETGALDQTVFRARLSELNLLTEWDHLQAEITRLKPARKKTANEIRRLAGLTYLKWRFPGSK